MLDNAHKIKSLIPKPSESTSAKPRKTRRDMLYIATGSFGLLGMATLVRPFFGHMAPAADTVHRKGIVVDLSAISEGQQLTIPWYKSLVFVRHRTPEDITSAQSAPMSALRHKESDNDRLIAGVDGQKNPKYLVIIGKCPHFGCVPISEQGDYGGWFCPCHGAHFDTSGRVRKGPPMTNMAIPPYQYISEDSIEILHPLTLN